MTLFVHSEFIAPAKAVSYTHLDGEVRGYAYAAVFKERVAYDWSVETTIYLNPEYKGRGYGKSLYEKLEELLKKQNIQNMNACIACIDEEDEYLTNDSPRFHHHMGFQMVGKFHKSGCKFGRWYDMIWICLLYTSL